MPRGIKEEDGEYIRWRFKEEDAVSQFCLNEFSYFLHHLLLNLKGCLLFLSSCSLGLDSCFVHKTDNDFLYSGVKSICIASFL